MEITTSHGNDTGVAPVLKPPDVGDCGDRCKNCEMLKEQLRKLSYCLAVAQRLSHIEID